MPFPKFPFVVLDTETTGLTPRVDRIIEFALIRYENGEKVAEYESLYEIPTEMSSVSRVLTRIDPSHLVGKPTLASEKEKIAKMMEGAVIVGQNILFDLKMLQGEGFEIDVYSWIDTAMLASLVYPELKSYSLGYLSEVLDLPHEPKHRAMGDVHATAALMEKAWERLNELPTDAVSVIKKFAEKGPEGYATLFALLESGAEKAPSWMKQEEQRNAHQLPLSSPKKERTWLAVKNIEATLKESEASEYEPVFAPQFLLNPQSGDALLKQDSFTADELTIAIKLHLYRPKRFADFPIHGGERDVWRGKLACTRESAAYTDQFDQKNHTLIDHRHLLELLLHDHAHAPKEGDAIIIADASMLEDTATKALKWSCSIDPLRAGAEGNAELTSFLDAYQIWLEKVRNSQDVRYLVQADLTSREAKGLSERLEGILQTNLGDQSREILIELKHILNPENLSNRIAYVSQFRDGGQILQSVPEDISVSLNTLLYEHFATTLLLPPGEAASFHSIIPLDASVTIDQEQLSAKPNLRYTEPEFTLDRLLPRIDGKVICLISSKRTIEQLYVKFVEQLEAEGITLIALGMSGGQGRMTAEFLATEDRTVWMTSPWMFEGLELPPNTVDHLWIHTLPFDHPSHAVLSIRAGKYAQQAFMAYFVPRLLHRLFRLIRTFTKFYKEDGDILVLDQRLKSKNYGERVVEYLNQITS